MTKQIMENYMKERISGSVLRFAAEVTEMLSKAKLTMNMLGSVDSSYTGHSYAHVPVLGLLETMIKSAKEEEGTEIPEEAIQAMLESVNNVELLISVTLFSNSAVEVPVVTKMHKALSDCMRTYLNKVSEEE